MDEQDEERFWQKVSTPSITDCWLWQAAKYPRGYGRFRLNGKVVRAHRLAYEMLKGPISPGMQLLHSCDVPACVNPLHLREGTNDENVADTVARQRQPAGARNAAAKLTDQQVADIRAVYASGAATQQELADQYGVGRPLISKIALRTRWAHLP